MAQEDASPSGVGDRELVMLRVALLRPFAESPPELADCAGLSVDDTVDAATRLAELGLVDWRDDDADLRPRLQHELWPALAARVAATPIRWPDTMSAPRDPQLVRRDIDDQPGKGWRRFREQRPDRFDAGLDDDACRAAALLWLGVLGFSESVYLTSRFAEAAYVLAPGAWRSAARCFPEGSLRQRIGFSLADSRTLPGWPPMLVVDRQRTNCGVCFRPVIRAEGRHITQLDSQLGEGLLSVTVASGDWADELPFEAGCGVVWTHYTLRAWLAEIMDWIGPDGKMRGRMEPLEALPDLIWLDP